MPTFEQLIMLVVPAVTLMAGLAASPVLTRLVDRDKTRADAAAALALAEKTRAEALALSTQQLMETLRANNQLRVDMAASEKHCDDRLAESEARCNERMEALEQKADLLVEEACKRADRAEERITSLEAKLGDTQELLDLREQELFDISHANS